MAPLITNVPRQEVKWSKLKSASMYNKTYYLRTHKLIVYQLATNSTQIATGLGVAALRHYLALQNTQVPDHPSAHFSATNFVGTFAIALFSCLFIGFFPGAAVFFEIFWPERVESRSAQLMWKIGMLAATVLQFVASLAFTIVVATGKVGIHGVTGEDEAMVRRDWGSSKLEYGDEKRALVSVVFCWIAFGLVGGSTIVMWKYYTHNNKYGPFADHVRKGHGEALEIGNASMEIGLR